MATLNITITTSDIDLLAKSLGYQATITDPENQVIANPETKGAFAKRLLIGQIKERIINQKKADTIEAANLVEPNIT